MCLVIGDFGLGSDTPLVLDYSLDEKTPVVKRLVWAKPKNYWEQIARSIDELINKLEIHKNVT